MDGKIAALKVHAEKSGATGVVVFPAEEIRVDDELAEMCRDGRCAYYGLSKSCPPHVSGPDAFGKKRDIFSRALFFKIEVPSEIMYSSERREVFQLLHETAAGIEKIALELGFADAEAYAGGSCKNIFCSDHADCRVLSGNGECRNPGRARPSMSGFGIDVAKLMAKAGWSLKEKEENGTADTPQMAGVYGLVLLKDR